MIVSTLQLETLRNNFNSRMDDAKPQLLRKISEFALQEIVCPPTGPYRNQPFSFEAQPFVRLWFSLIESEQYSRYAVTGPTQTGKTFNALVIPAMYYLFEVGENVIYGIPHMKMARDKWEKDLLPAIEASRYADLMPKKGQGSKGGDFDSITFQNGATLKFMAAKGGDENRSGITSRILLMTEIDKYDMPRGESRESDPITQMIARLDAYDDASKVVFMECTPSIKTGRIWVEYTNGSNSRIAMKCPHCLEYVTLEREHLIGWQEAKNEIEARENARFACPQCGGIWTEEQRAEANTNAKLVHDGQTIAADGTISGERPQTTTAGFRWNAANNLFRPAADIGAREWASLNKPNEESNEKALCQFVWAMPANDTKADETPLNVTDLMERMHAEGRGIVPADCDLMSVGIDLGGWWCHWVAYAWGSRARGYIIDYGKIAVPQATLGLEAGLMEAMREFRELCGRGWSKATGEPVIPDENLLDSGWQTPAVYKFIQETGLPFRPCKGLSVSGEPVSYTRPKSTGAVVQWIGDGWHIARLKDEEIYLVEIDADEAKSSLHTRLNCDITAPGAITMFQFDRTNAKEAEERRTVVQHLTAEKSVTEFKPGKGTITRWVKVRRHNHYLDGAALGLVGGSINGVSAIEMESEEPPQAPMPVVSAETKVGLVKSGGIVREVRSGWVRKQR